MHVWIYTLLAVTAVSLVSFVGALTLGLSELRLRSILSYLIGFAAGALLGDVFLHVLPELGEAGFSVGSGALLLGCIFVFLLLDRFLFWHRPHGDHDESVHQVVYLTLAGDAAHNFIDGTIIAASFLVSVPVGIATTVAVLLHEIPHEMGNFAVLVHGGWSRNKALLYNFLSALFSVLGAVFVLILSRTSGTVPSTRLLLSFGAASFIYVAMSDLLPELAGTKSLKKGAIELLCVGLGAAAMALILLLE